MIASLRICTAFLTVLMWFYCKKRDCQILIVIKFNKVSGDFIFFHSSAMETKLHSDILTDRPFSGTAVPVKSSLTNRVQSVVTNNPRITAVLLKNDTVQDIVISSIYIYIYICH